MLSFLSKPVQDNSPALSPAQSVWHVHFKASWRDTGRLFCALSWWHCIVAGEGHVRHDKAWTMFAVFVNRSTRSQKKAEQGWFSLIKPKSCPRAKAKAYRFKENLDKWLKRLKLLTAFRGVTTPRWRRSNNGKEEERSAGGQWSTRICIKVSLIIICCHIPVIILTPCLYNLWPLLALHVWISRCLTLFNSLTLTDAKHWYFDILKHCYFGWM